LKTGFSASRRTASARKPMATERFTFTGASQIVSPEGNLLTSGPSEGDYAAVVEIDPSAATDKHINRYNDLFRQRRPEFYHAIAEHRNPKE